MTQPGALRRSPFEMRVANSAAFARGDIVVITGADSESVVVWSSRGATLTVVAVGSWRHRLAQLQNHIAHLRRLVTGVLWSMLDPDENDL